MQLFSWLTKRMTGRRQNRRAPACRPAPRFRPHLEALEDRTVPSTFYAATASDLIQDIQAANQQGGANTIVLTAPASSPYAMTAANNSTDGPTALPQITSGDNLTIRTGNGTATPGYGDALDAGKGGRLFDVAAGGSLTLQNLTLQNGQVIGLGGPTITAKGGAISNHGTLILSQVMVQNCATVGFRGQVASAAGGGIWSDGSLTVENSTFNGNSATGSDGSGGQKGGNAYGGALYIAGGSASITGSFFGQGNSALGGTAGAGGGGSAYGGAVYVAAGTVTMNADTVGNPPGTTGAKSNVAQGASASAVGYGGGIYVAGGHVTLTNDTIEYNTAAGIGQNGAFEPIPTLVGHGGGVFVASGASVSIDSFTLAHTILNKSFRNINIDGTYTLLK